MGWLVGWLIGRLQARKHGRSFHSCTLLLIFKQYVCLYLYLYLPHVPSHRRLHNMYLLPERAEIEHDILHTIETNA